MARHDDPVEVQGASVAEEYVVSGGCTGDVVIIVTAWDSCCGKIRHR